MHRQLMAALAAALLLVAVPAVANAAPATRFTDHAVVVDCGFLQSDDGVVVAFAVDSTQDGAFGDLAFWQAPATPDTDDPTLVSEAADVAATDASLSADYTLVDLNTGDPAGTAELRVTLEPSGPAEPIDDRFKEGNRWQKVTGTIQPMAVSGTARGSRRGALRRVGMLRRRCRTSSSSPPTRRRSWIASTTSPCPARGRSPAGSSTCSRAGTPSARPRSCS